MGLGFVQSDASWSYSGFMHFRERLAEDIGIILRDMYGFGEDDGISWNTIDSDLFPLLNHSDCEGEMSPQECAQVAPALRKILESWPDEDYDTIQGLLLVEGMERCADEGIPLEFC